MPVIQVSAPIKVEANSVYVIPPRKHLLMADGHLILTVLPHEHGKRSAVDIFFSTLAETHRSGSTAIVLSGCSRRRRHRNSADQRGWWNHVAQKPEKAQHEGMPRSAIETGMVDWVLPVAEMPRRLLENLRKSSS
jgi:two-component system CheB/CheR fusion protein